MTKEEAINILTYHKNNVPENSLITDALNMAVKALKQTDCGVCKYLVTDEVFDEEIGEEIDASYCDKLCEDAISRQAVLDYFFRPYSNEELYSNIDIARFIKGLPSVTPKQKIGYWVFPISTTKMICTCSCCGGDGTAFGKDKFCRNCGAKMVEREDKG